MASTNPDQKGKAAATAADDDDDLDDLDDLVDQFSAPSAPTASAPKPAAPAPTNAADGPDPSVIFPSGVRPSASVDPADSDSDEEVEDEDAFARDLAEGMDALLSSMGTGDDAEFAKKFEALMRGDPEAAAGLFGPPPPAPGAAAPSAGAAKGKAAAGPAPAGPNPAAGPDGTQRSFQDTIMETMNKLKESDTSATAKSNSDEDMMAALMEQFLGSTGGDGSDQDLQSMLQGFMDELMSKAIMYQPMKELNDQYPGWIESHRSSLSPPELDRYTRQSKIIASVVAVFEDPQWDVDENLASTKSDPAAKERLAKRQAEVTDLMTKMQECGSPPKEIMGDLPEGMQLGEDGMPDMEKCTIS